MTGKHIERLHIVGGGSKNRLLNQFTANVLQKPVHAGPAEATAMGNLLVQALTIGHLRTLEEARQVVGASTHVEIFLPQAGHEWEQAAARFSSLI